MRESTVLNYGLPGVNSSLIRNGIVRVLESTREQQEAITPHSHKFDFTCLVLAGTVKNRVWSKDAKGDDFMVSELSYLGEMGKYEKQPLQPDKYSFKDSEYRVGEWYSMAADEIHSIYFSKGCIVLFFEGAVKTNKTIILDPYVNDKHLEVFEVKPWMFEKIIQNPLA